MAAACTIAEVFLFCRLFRWFYEEAGLKNVKYKNIKKDNYFGRSRIAPNTAPP